MASDNEPTTTEQQEAGQTVDTMMEQAHEVASSAANPESGGLDMLMGVSLTMSVELGRARMQVADILNLGSGSVIELQKLASEPVDILVNDSPFARGEVVVIEDHFAIKITELLENSEVAALGGAD
jgi:flagellar motor switch protein FliN